MEQERKCVVYEHRKGGGRFMTTYIEGNAYEDNEHHIIVEKNVSEETARLLCGQRQENTIKSFLSDLPDELRDPETDAFIANMIRGAK